MENNFDAALKEFLSYCQSKICSHYAKSFPHVTPTTLETTPGRKYIKITGSHGVGRSAWAFIEIATGNILRAASWSAPAKTARGNIYRPETWTTVTVYGPQYLR